MVSANPMITMNIPAFLIKLLLEIGQKDKICLK